LCNKMGLEKESFFWHCDKCKYDSCTACQLPVDHETGKYAQQEA
jgi:hypothetical protein